MKKIDWLAVKNFLNGEKDEIEKLLSELQHEWFFVIEYVPYKVHVIVGKKARDRRRKWSFGPTGACYYLTDEEKNAAADLMKGVAEKRGLRIRMDWRGSTGENLLYKFSPNYQNFRFNRVDGG